MHLIIIIIIMIYIFVFILPVSHGVCSSQMPIYEAEDSIVKAKQDWVDQVSQSYWPRADTKIK